MTSPKRHPAFTLTELLLVVLLIGILAGGAAVNFQGRSKSKALAFAAKDLAAALEYGIARSSQSELSCRLAFDQQWRQYRLEEAPRLSQEAYVPLAGPAGRWRPLPAGVLVAAVRQGDKPIDPLPGTICLISGAEGFSGSIELTDSAGQAARVNVLPITRQVTHEP